MKQPARRGGAENGNPTLLTYLKSLLFACLTTMVLILGLAFLMYQFHLSGQITNIFIVLITILGAFLAGFLAAGRVQEKKFLYGLMMGGAFFAVLLLASFLFKSGFNGGIRKLFTALCLCAGGGMLGGMVR